MFTKIKLITITCIFIFNATGPAQTESNVGRNHPGSLKMNPTEMTDTEYTRQVPQHPIRPETDLRDMLRRYLITRSLAAMEHADSSRAAALKTGQTQAYQERIIKAVKNFHGEMPVGKNGAPIQVTHVSSFEKDGYRIENILFDSFPRWQVNATVYVPLNFEPPFQAVVVPVGHSGKQFKNYQLPCQYFAKSGYLTITFDPPGQASEKQPGNDHFTDGVRCYLTGETSSKYFIADAIRCVDYLETRPDVDLSHGVAMTGVSGGGTTTIFAGILDDRFTVLGPSCCVAPLADHSIRQCYAGCPEGKMFRRYAEGVDNVDLLCAACPKPTLLMAGAKDEVLRVENTQKLANLVDGFYEAAGKPDQFRFFVDDGGHGYSLEQAKQFVQFMDKWLAGRSARPLPEPDEANFEMNPYTELRCYPRTDVNMLTLTRDNAEILKQDWDLRPAKIHATARYLAQVSGEISVPQAKISAPFLVWTHYWQNVLLQPEPGIELPATLFQAPPEKNHGTILHFDDQGRHQMMERQNHLMRSLNFLDRPAEKISLFSVDLRGWGDTEMSVYPYEVASWGGRDRFTAYTSFALGDPILSMRIRDGLSALAWLRSQPDGSKPILLTGAGLGGIVALHVAAIDRNVAGVLIWDSLISYRELLEAPRFPWSAEIFLPEILKFYDLPELVASLPMDAFIFNPLGGDGKKQPDQKLKQLNTRLKKDIYQNAEWPEMIETIQQLFFQTETGRSEK